MGNWKDHSSSSLVRMLLVGDSGAGKTTQLGLLANAGYKVVIADFANGLDALGNVLTDEGKENVYFKTFRDNVFSTDKGAINAWVSFKAEMRKGDWAGIGPVSSWDSSVVFAVDDLSGATDAARHYALNLSGKKPHERPSLPDWGNINDELDVYIMQAVTGDLNCNVILNTHWQLVDDEEGSSRFYPKVGTKNNSANNSSRHFNNAVWLKSDRKGNRVFRTSGDTSRDLKVSRSMPTEIEANLADLLTALTT